MMILIRLDGDDWLDIDVLAQRPITLVLIMINSCSYSLLMILCLISFRYLIKILVGN